MIIKKKYISKDNWERVLERKVANIPFKYKNSQGEAFLIKINKVKEPLYKQYNNENKKLADKGYYWLQLAIENENYWITAMYDNNKNLVQYYIDITKENKIKLNGESYFYDLFLDIVRLHNGEIYLLDEDEITDALNDNVINKFTFDFAHAEAKKIIEELENNKFEPIKMCQIYFEKLCNILDIENFT